MTMRQRILQAIHEHRLTMKPRWRMFLSTSFSFSTVGALALLLLFLESFLIYSVYQNGSAFLLRSGWAGILALFGTLPWLPITLGLGAAVGLGILINQRTQTYRLPFAYTLGMVIAVILGCSYVIATTTLHPAIAGFVEAHNTPVLHPFYDSLPKTEANQTVVGEVQDIQGQSMTVQNRQGGTVRVQVQASERTGNSKKLNVKKGDVVVVIEKKQEQLLATNAAPAADGNDDEHDDAKPEDAVESEYVHILPEKYQRGVRNDIAEKLKEMRESVKEREDGADTQSTGDKDQTLLKER
jgi:hypothetical protein